MLGAAPFPAPFWAIVRTPTNGQAKTGSASTDARQPFVLASGVRSETLGVPTFCRPSAPRRVSAHMLAAGALLDALLSIVYRPGFSGHEILLCDRPYWGECGEPFAPGLSRAAVGILLQQPVLVIARDEG